MDSRPSVVELELELNLVLSPERSVPVPARLSYGSHDPYAVHITFHLDTGTPVTWVFSRELLVEGTFRPCGQGDVRIWPTRPHPRPRLHTAGGRACSASRSPHRAGTRCWRRRCRPWPPGWSERTGWCRRAVS